MPIRLENAAPRAVFEAKLTGTFKKTRIANLFRGSGGYVDNQANQFDVLLVDEAHRLNEKVACMATWAKTKLKN